MSRLSAPLQEEANRPLPRHLELQAALQKLGYIPPTDRVDGVYGPATRMAITAWQTTSNLSPSGVLSASDAQLLLREPNGNQISATPPPTASVPETTASKVPKIDETAVRAADERKLAIAKAEAEKAKAEAEKAQADAERAGAEAQIIAARERAEVDARQKAVAQAQAEQNAHGIQP